MPLHLLSYLLETHGQLPVFVPVSSQKMSLQTPPWTILALSTWPPILQPLSLSSCFVSPMLFITIHMYLDHVLFTCLLAIPPLHVYSSQGGLLCLVHGSTNASNNAWHSEALNKKTLALLNYRPANPQHFSTKVKEVLFVGKIFIIHPRLLN